VWAPILLTLLRVCQGLGAGAELGAALVGFSPLISAALLGALDGRPWLVAAWMIFTAAVSLRQVVAGRAGWAAAAPSRASQSRMTATVHSGRSSIGTCPVSAATSNRQEGFAAAALLAAASGTSRSVSPWSSRTGAVTAAIMARALARRPSSHSSERAASRGGGRLQQGDQAAHRVANQDRGAADDLVEEAVEQPPVGLDGRGAAGRRREAVTGEVDGEDPMVLGERGTDREPVDVRAAEAVHADQHGRSRRTAEVDEVNRAANLDGPRGRRRARAPTCVHEV
jgi:hypothetical protein